FLRPSSTAVCTFSLHDALPIYLSGDLGKGLLNLVAFLHALAGQALALGDSVDDGLGTILKIVDHLLDFRSGFLGAAGQGTDFVRSEEHTSELQSRENLVCRLLL